VTPGEQSLAVAGVILLVIGVVWAMSRPQQVRIERGAPVSRQGGAGGAVRRGVPAALTPLPQLAQGGRLERGDALPLRPLPRTEPPRQWADPALAAGARKAR
jgi:hypothetical protein